MIIGFSTGFLYKTKNYDRVSIEAVKLIQSIGCNAIEFMTINRENLQKIFDNISRDKLKKFEFVSLHLPKGIFQEDKREETIEVLELVQKIHEKLKLNNVVIHPDEVSDWSVFSKFSFPFAIENMDNRKKTHKSINDMRKTFQITSAKMVLDVNHCFANDATMKLAQDFIKEFGDRMNEVHLSGFVDFHEPLFQTKQEEILNSVPGIELPIIIESGCENIEDAKKEIDYIKENLNRKFI